MKKTNQPKNALSAMKKANRELAFERNGGGQFIAASKAHTNKKKYNRKRDKRNFDLPLYFFIISFLN